MDRVCPRCRGTTPHLLCPKCGARTADADAPMTAAVPAEEASPIAGLLIGLLLAQGLYYALRHLAVAWLLATGDPAGETDFWEKSFSGFVTAQALQGGALLIGSMLAAAGRRQGLILGAGLGFVNAMLLLCLQRLLRQPLDDLTWYGQPLLHMFVGAVGGAIGSRIWQPAPELPPLTGDGRAGREVLTTILPEQSTAVEVEPWPWAHILIGTVLAIGGTLGARMIRELVVVAGGGTGREMQSQFITWEIALVAQLMGGLIAGAGTRGGVLYGLWVGLPSAAFLTVVQALAAIRVPTQAVSAWLLGVSVPEGSPAALVIQGIQAVAFCVIGGWLGTIILPVNPGRRSGDDG
jgi:hypothetical protein